MKKLSVEKQVNIVRDKLLEMMQDVKDDVEVPNFIYGAMLGILRKRLNILSCSKSLTGVLKSELVFTSEVTKIWLKNRK